MRPKKHALVTTSLVFIGALLSAPARATDIDGASAIDTVTVYPDGATVTRVISLDLPSGDTTLVTKDFPLTLDPSSLRVEGEAATRSRWSKSTAQCRPTSSPGCRRCRRSSRPRRWSSKEASVF